MINKISLFDKSDAKIATLTHENSGPAYGKRGNTHAYLKSDANIKILNSKGEHYILKAGEKNMRYNYPPSDSISIKFQDILSTLSSSQFHHNYNNKIRNECFLECDEIASGNDRFQCSEECNKYSCANVKFNFQEFEMDCLSMCNGECEIHGVDVSLI